MERIRGSRNDTPLRIWGSVDPFRNSTLMSYGEKESRSNERNSGRGVEAYGAKSLDAISPDFVNSFRWKNNSASAVQGS